MQFIPESSRIVAPTSQMLSTEWSTQAFAWDAFFDAQLAKKQDEILFYKLDHNSPLFTEACTQCLNRGYRPNFVFSMEQFSRATDVLESHFRAGLFFSIIISEEIPPAVMLELEKLQQWKNQLSLVIIARRDWDFSQTYRCIPQLFRDRLFIDFPVSFSQGDPFYSPQDLSNLRNSLNVHFGQSTLPSFCPNLRIYAEGNLPQPVQSTARFDAEIFPFVPMISIIARDDESLQTILSSAAVMQNQNQIEVIGGNASQEILLQYSHGFNGRALFFDNLESESSGLALNQLSQRASGTYYLFSDSCSLATINELIFGIFDQNKSAVELAMSHHSPIFNSDQFFSQGGFEATAMSFEATWVEALVRSMISSPKDVESGWYKTLLEKSGLRSIDRRIILQTHYQFLPAREDNYEAQLIPKYEASESLPVTGKAYHWLKIKSLYSQLFKFNISVFLEGHLAFLVFLFKKIFSPLIPRKGSWLDVRRYQMYWDVRHWAKTRLWKISPKQLGWYLHRWTAPLRSVTIFFRYRLLSPLVSGLLKLNPVRYSIYWKTRHWLKTHLWRFGPQQVGWIFHRIAAPVVIRLKPDRYSIYWKTRHWLKTHLWRFGPQQVGWNIHRITVPVVIRLKPDRYSIYWKTRHWLKTHLWRFGPQQVGWIIHRITAPVVIRLKPDRYSIYWKTRHWLKTHLWRFGPQQVGWIFHRITAPVVLRLKPDRYSIYWKTRHWLKTHLWRFSPRQLGWLVHRLTAPLRSLKLFIQYRIFAYLKSLVSSLNFTRYSFYWTSRHFIVTNLWRLSPARLGWWIHRSLSPVRLWLKVLFLYRLPSVLNMKSYLWFWKLRHTIKTNLWRVGPQQLGWYSFRLSYPFRKIYYFTRFQYEKRVLRLHHKRIRS